MCHVFARNDFSVMDKYSKVSCVNVRVQITIEN